MPLLLPRNSLCYPAGVAPGFDPSHFAAPSCKISVLPAGNSLRNLLNGKIGTVNGSPTSGLDGRIGPYGLCSGSSDNVTFTSMPTITDNAGTIAAVIIPTETAAGTTKILFYGNSGNSGWAIGILGTGLGQVYVSSDPTGSGYVGGGTAAALTVGVPYFIIGSGSVSLNKANFLVMRLDNGQVKTSTATPSSPFANSAFPSTWVVGGYSTILPGKSEVAALSYHSRWTSIQEMLTWAADPWSFWYPKQKPIIINTPIVPKLSLKTVGGGVVRGPNNPLVFPAGIAPGFDPSHPAANGCLFSGVSAGANFTNLLNGKSGTVAGTPSNAVGGIIGPSTNYGSGGTADGSKYTGFPVVVPNTFTFASVFTVNQLTAVYQSLLSTSSSTLGMQVAVRNGYNGNQVTVDCYGQGTPVLAGITFPSANVPYFMAISYTNNYKAFVILKQLDNGKINTYTITTTSFTWLNGNGTLQIGNTTGTGDGIAYSNIAAVSLSYNNALSLQQLLAWASDPWSFWYPRRTGISVSTKGIAPRPTATGARVMPVLRPNTLAFPAGAAPGFDPSHPFATGTLFSGITTGISVFDLIAKQSGALEFSPSSYTASVNGFVGPCVSTPGNGNLTYTGRPSAAPTSVTCAALLMTTSGTDGSWFSNSTLATSTYFGMAAAGMLLQTNGGYLIVGSLATNTPYFCAASFNSGATNWVILNLANGKVQSGSTTGLTPYAGNGTYTIGVRGNTIGFQLAATMFSSAFYSVARLKSFAVDPWSFWYPRRSIIDVAGTDALSTVDFRRTLSRIGTRVRSRQQQVF